MLVRKKILSSVVVGLEGIEVIADLMGAIINPVGMILFQFRFHAKVLHDSLVDLVIVETARRDLWIQAMEKGRLCDLNGFSLVLYKVHKWSKLLTFEQ